MDTFEQAELRLNERADLLDFLLEVSTVTGETLDLDHLLENVAQIVRKVLPYELFAILLFNEKSQELRIRYAVGHREEVVRNLVIALGEGVTGTAAALREPVLAPDVRLYEPYLSGLDAVRSELAVPMITRKKLVGVIDVQSTREGTYSEQDRDILRLIGSRVATAIDNARLYRRAERQNKTLKTLALISQEFSSILDLDGLLNKIASSMHRLIDYDSFSILLVDYEQKVLRHRFSMRYDERVNIDNIPLGKGITGAAAETREAVRVHDITTDPRYIASHPDILSEVAVPLMMRDRVVGVMDMESNRIGHFTDDHMRTLSLLAPQIAISIENARLYEELGSRERLMQEDLRAASGLQAVLLPAEAPFMKGLEVGIGLRPAREISGDLYDFFEHRGQKLSETHTVIAFGDSSGKGTAAALYGAVLNGLMRTLAPRRPSPADLMKALNDQLVLRKVEARYVTLLLMLWHPHTKHFDMANAGATPPMVCRNGEILKIQVAGVPLGLLPDREYEPQRFQAQPGDTIVLFSDGISDHLSASGIEYGRNRLARVVRGGCDLTSQGLVEAVFEDLDKFNTVRFDDQTVIVMKVRGRRVKSS